MTRFAALPPHSAVLSHGSPELQASELNGLGGMREAVTININMKINTNITIDETKAPSLSQEIEAKIKGYEGEACGECGNFTLVRNGTCMKCNTCGATSGCS